MEARYGDQVLAHLNLARRVRRPMGMPSTPKSMTEKGESNPFNNMRLDAISQKLAAGTRKVFEASGGIIKDLAYDFMSGAKTVVVGGPGQGIYMKVI